MTTLRLEDIPSIRSAPRSYVQMSPTDGTGRARFALDRRAFIKAAAATGMAAGIWMIGNLPPARRALASHAGDFGYRIKELPCPGFSCYSSGNQLCDDSIEGPCCPSKVHPFGCEDSGHKLGWHKDASFANWDLRPNDCPVNEKDGWKWRVNTACGPCAGCESTLFRCHDGLHYHSGVPENSVCKWAIACGPCG